MLRLSGCTRRRLSGCRWAEPGFFNNCLQQAPQAVGRKLRQINDDGRCSLQFMHALGHTFSVPIKLVATCLELYCSVATLAIDCTNTATFWPASTVYIYMAVNMDRVSEASKRVRTHNDYVRTMHTYFKSIVNQSIVSLGRAQGKQLQE